MGYLETYNLWLENVKDKKLKTELESMTDEVPAEEIVTDEPAAEDIDLHAELEDLRHARHLRRRL